MAGPFDDLIPKNSGFAQAGASASPAAPQVPQQQANPFSDLIPQTAPRPGQAMASQTPMAQEPQQGGGFGFMTGIENLYRGLGQRTNPNVIGGKGEQLRPMLGEIVSQDDAGTYYYRTPDGNELPATGKNVIVMRDPTTNKLTAYDDSNPEWQESPIFGFSRLMSQGMLTGNPSSRMSPSVPAQTTTGTQRAAQRAQQATEDLAAFERQGVRPFGPAFSSPPTASVAKQLSETPLIGAPVRNALEESIEGARNAVERTASNIARPATVADVGDTVRQGVDRFRFSGLSDLPAEDLQRIGVNPKRAVPQQAARSGGQVDRATQADPIRQQIGTQRPALPQVTRASAEDLSDADLRNIIRTPARDTSLSAKAEALYERAFRRVPALMRSNDTANPNLLPTPNTQQALGQVQRQIANSISGQGVVGGGIAERLLNPRSNFTLSDLRAIRTEVGRALGNTNPLNQTLSRSQLKSIYGALSRDIEVGLDDLANRAAIATRNNRNPQTAQQAREAARALTDFRRADTFFREGMERMDDLLTLTRSTSPEQAAQRLARAALDGGRGNVRLLVSARRVLRPEEWNDVAALTLRQLGEPVGSARGASQELGFSVSSFMTRWNNMSPAARQTLFGGEHAAAIEDLNRIMTRLSDVEATANVSRSATNATNVGGVFATGLGVASGDPTLVLGPAAAGYTASVLLSRPQYARWATQYARLKAQALRGSTQATNQIPAHINRLALLARSNPELVPALRALQAEEGIAEGAGEQNEVDGEMR